jgi:hypothetical protein
VLMVMDQFTRRLVGFGVHSGAPTSADVCRMFNVAVRGQRVPQQLSPPEFSGLCARAAGLTAAVSPGLHSTATASQQRRHPERTEFMSLCPT